MKREKCTNYHCEKCWSRYELVVLLLENKIDHKTMVKIEAKKLSRYLNNIGTEKGK